MRQAWSTWSQFSNVPSWLGKYEFVIAILTYINEFKIYFFVYTKLFSQSIYLILEHRSS